MRLHRFTARELAAERAGGRILQVVPRGEIDVTQLIVRDRSTPMRFAFTWPRGPRGHALVGICPDGCCFVAEFPWQWRYRGREIARSILELPPMIDDVTATKDDRSGFLSGSS